VGRGECPAHRELRSRRDRDDERRTRLVAASARSRLASLANGSRSTLTASSFRRRHTPVPMNYVRLTQPLVRDSKGAELRPASWDEALAKVVAGFNAAKAQHGPTTFGVFSCSKATNEVNFAAQKFSRAVLGSNNIDSCNRT
jgi:anaerobic selenocysteine-containing dehydrogenase